MVRALSLLFSIPPPTVTIARPSPPPHNNFSYKVSPYPLFFKKGSREEDLSSSELLSDRNSSQFCHNRLLNKWLLTDSLSVCESGGVSALEFRDTNLSLCLHHSGSGSGVKKPV